MSDLDTIHTATNCLHQLLAVIYEQATDLYDGELDAHTRATADRLAALAILARDEAERIDTAIGDAITSTGEARRVEVDVVRTLGEEYEEAIETWCDADEAAEKAEKSDSPNAETLRAAATRAEEIHDQYRDHLFNFELDQSSLPALAERATILLRKWNSAEGLNERRVVQLLTSLGGRQP